MESKILSLNIGGPEEMVWNDKSVVSSMHKKPVDGPLIVSETSIEGDSFANPKFHGTPHSVLYAFGLSSIELFLKEIGRDLSTYKFGDIGETLTLDHFDEREVSVGDIFQIGEVIAQATWPRIPCAKVNFRVQHAKGQMALFECGVSGVYFRILKPGKIAKSDLVTRIDEAKVHFKIFDLYPKAFLKKYTLEDLERAVANGAFPEPEIEKWKTRLQNS